VLVGRLQSAHDSVVLPLGLSMAELAADAVRAAAVLPESVAFSALGGGLGWSADQLVPAVGETALVLVGTVSQL
jgi:hypothetical protein